jgi:hypothetical protein
MTFSGMGLNGLLSLHHSSVTLMISRFGGGLLVGLILAGCASRTEPQAQYVRVEVPVPVPCRAPEVTVPSWAAAGLRKSDSLEVKVRALLAERRQRIGYERLLEAAVDACR